MSTSISYGRTGDSKKSDALGMRDMQRRAYKERGAQYLLLKAPPAAGKSRALMFVALDKLHSQSIRKVIVAVPERAIGGSFKDTKLKEHGFHWDWSINPRYDLCSVHDEVSAGTVERFKEFMESDEQVLLCTHATLRFAFQQIPVEAFDECLLAVDEFHHASAAEDNILGRTVRALMERDRCHIMAMTGSYFRGDENAVMRPEDEARFQQVTYSYYDQLNGYEHLKNLEVNFHFYREDWLSALPDVLDTDRPTILHIPNVNSAESTKDKYGEADRVLDRIGEVQHVDPETGFYIIQRHGDGKIVRVANLVDDDTEKRDRLRKSLRSIERREDLDLIIALGMAKEGFDWVWCEMALTVGYRNSMTEVIQIIGRATRDAPGKETATFLNLVAEPAADEGVVSEGVNSLLKAISVSLLMEQIMTPKVKLFDSRKEPDRKSFDHDPETGIVSVGIADLPELSPEGQKAVDEADDLIAAFYQSAEVVRAGLDPQISLETLMQCKLPEIVQSRHSLPDNEAADVAKYVAAQMALKEQMKQDLKAGTDNKFEALAERLTVDELTLDMINSVNPFEDGWKILSKTIDEKLLADVKANIELRRNPVSKKEVEVNYSKIYRMREQGKTPDPRSPDPQERRLYQI